MNYSGEGEKSGLALGLGTHVKMLMTTLKRVKIECIASKAVEGEMNFKNLVILRNRKSKNIEIKKNIEIQ